MTILHVDDEPNDQFLLQEACRHIKELRVESVNDGDLAVAYLNGHGIYSERERSPLPDLMLLDLKMPLKNGFEVLIWVRAHARFKRLPVVVLTASKQKIDINRAYELGANSYIVKPIGLEALSSTMTLAHEYWCKLCQLPLE